MTPPTRPRIRRQPVSLRARPVANPPAGKKPNGCQSIIRLLALFCCLSVVPAQAGPTWTPRYVNTTVNGQVVPVGYYEYLPTAYNASPQSLTNFPVVIFVHGSGQYGDGTATGNPGLANILTDGLCLFIQDNDYPVAQAGGVFDLNNVIVLCPQDSVTWPMADATFRSFYNFAMAAYPKIDKRRIWFTGLSYGSTTVTTALDYTQDPSPDDPAAVLACAWRGDDLDSPVLVPPIANIGKVVPLWVLTSQSDTSSDPDACVNALAAAISGSTNLPSDISVFPSGNFTNTYTAYFNGASWILSSQQMDPITGVNPKMTYFIPSVGHDSWGLTYLNVNTWAWLFQQQKPNVSITSPPSNVISPQGSPLTFTGMASDMTGATLAGSSLLWSDSINGVLGTGASVTITNLSIGAHIVKLQATDKSYRDNKTTINVTVPYTGAFTAFFDFGPTGLDTNGWNDISSTSVSTVTNAVNDNGTPIGINLAISSPFVGTQNAGVAASNLYPLTAQEDTLYVGGTGEPQTAQLLLSGLNPSESYNFTFFASRNVTDDRTSTYTINGNTVSLQAAGNISNIVSLDSVTPNSSGQVVVTIGHGTNATYGYLGVMVVSTGSVAPVITDGPPPSVAPRNSPYTFIYTASGVPVPAYSVTAGSLPLGLTLSPAGIISGAPTTLGTYNGTVTASNGIGNPFSQNFSITVQNPTPPTITSTPPSTTSFGAPYSFTYQFTGNPPPTFSVTAGALPPGLSLSPAGVISGTSTAAGLFTGTVTASNGASPNATQNFSIAVQEAPAISGSGGLVNIATNGTAILGYNTGTLTTLGTALAHDGVARTINDGIGATSVDTYGNLGNYGYVGITFPSPITSTVTSLNLTMHIFIEGGWFGPNNVSAMGVAGGPTGGNLVATALTDPPYPQVQATIDGTNWFNVAAVNNYVSLLTGVAANSTIAPAATFTLTTPLTGIEGIRIVGHNGGTGTPGSYPGFIGVNQLQVETQSIPNGTMGVPYNYAFSATGYPVPVFSVTSGALPPGLRLTPTGVILGTPTTAGAYSGVISASNGIGASATQNFYITIISAPMFGTPHLLANGGVQFPVMDLAGQTYVIQTSTNLINWTPIYTNSVSYTFSNTIVKSLPACFYRVVW